MLSKQKEIETTMEKKDMGMFFVKTVYSITIQFNFLRYKVNLHTFLRDNQRMFTECSLMNISALLNKLFKKFHF